MQSSPWTATKPCLPHRRPQTKNAQNLGLEAPTELRKTLYIWCWADDVNYGSHLSSPIEALQMTNIAIACVVTEDRHKAVVVKCDQPKGSLAQNAKHISTKMLGPCGTHDIVVVHVAFQVNLCY